MLVFAIGGFVTAAYIRWKKENQTPLKCPLYSDCSAVIYSAYSRFLGIPVEILGLLYYASIAVGTTILLVLPSAGASFTLGFQALTTVAFLFSVYLVLIQLLVVKQWCTWCLLSAALSTLVFLSSVVGSLVDLSFILATTRVPLLFLHVLGAAIGVGAATSADLLFVKFLKDARVAAWEADVLRTLGQVAWVALALLMLAVFGFIFSARVAFTEPPAIGAEVVVLLVLIVNSALLHFLVSPTLTHFYLDDDHPHRPGEIPRLKKLAFALSAISLVSWYTLFALVALTEEDARLSLSDVLLVYFFVVIAAVTVSQFVERSFERRAQLALGKSRINPRVLTGS